MKWVICHNYDTQHAVNSDKIRSVNFITDPKSWHKKHIIKDMCGERYHTNNYDIIIETDDGKYHLFYNSHDYKNMVDLELSEATIIHQRLLVALGTVPDGTIIIPEYDEDMYRGIFPKDEVLVLWDYICEATAPVDYVKELVFDIDDGVGNNLHDLIDLWANYNPQIIDNLEQYPSVFLGKIKVPNNKDGE